MDNPFMLPDDRNSYGLLLLLVALVLTGATLLAGIALLEYIVLR
jgi:hypothetical protein